MMRLAAAALVVGVLAAGCGATASSSPPAFGPNATQGFRAPNDAAWSAKCLWSHQDTTVDPIVSFGEPMSAHMHSFYGANGITPTTTPAELRARSTTNYCTVSVDDPSHPGTQLPDLAAYWYPTLYLTAAKTTSVKPGYLLAYYRSAGIDPHTVNAPPQDLAMVGGNSKAITPQLVNVSYYCIAGNAKTLSLNTLPDACPVVNNLGQPYQLKMVVWFPNCLSGAAVPPNWTPGMTYAIGNPDPKSKWASVCPTGYTPIPQVQLEARYNMTLFPVNGLNYDLSGATLASDSINGTGAHGITLHADFMSGWTTAELTTLVEWCYHGGPSGQGPAINCGAFGHGNR